MKDSIYYPKKAFGSQPKENLSVEDVLQTCFFKKTLKSLEDCQSPFWEILGDLTRNKFY